MVPSLDLLSGASGIPSITGGHAGPSTATGGSSPAAVNFASPFVIAGSGSRDIAASSTGGAGAGAGTGASGYATGTPWWLLPAVAIAAGLGLVAFLVLRR